MLGGDNDERRKSKGKEGQGLLSSDWLFAAYFHSLSTLLGWNALEERDSQKAEVVNGFYIPLFKSE